VNSNPTPPTDTFVGKVQRWAFLLPYIDMGRDYLSPELADGEAIGWA